jgi:hypothetical protein
MSTDRADLRERYKTLFAQVSNALWTANPIGIYGGPDDEYDPEVGTILPRLETARSPDDVQKIVFEEFARWFGKSSVGEYENFSEVSGTIWELWCEFKVRKPSLRKNVFERTDDAT